MKVVNFKFIGVICSSDDNRCSVSQVECGKYPTLLYTYDFKSRLIKYNNYYEMVLDFQSRIKFLSAGNKRHFYNTDYGNSFLTKAYSFAFPKNHGTLH